MSHRNGKPKPSARERTKYRWRMRHEVETPEDTKRLGIYDSIKAKLNMFRHPEERREHLI